LITLVLGGARSGKSAWAERLVATLPGPVTYVATLHVGDIDDDRGADPGADGDGDGDVDADLVARVRAHRERRPPEWSTIEAGPDLAQVLRSRPGTVLLDSLGPWLAVHPLVNHAELCRALLERVGDTVVVTEEVGLGVHPSSEAGRRFRDALGRLNQDIAAVSDHVYLVVAGRALRLDDPEPVPPGPVPSGDGPS
jgi:adenosyl cobinamide kinase/adenosyl cobinamide phosphate guanylyltransferase